MAPTAPASAPGVTRLMWNPYLPLWAARRLGGRRAVAGVLFARLLRRLRPTRRFVPDEWPYPDEDPPDPL